MTLFQLCVSAGRSIVSVQKGLVCIKSWCVALVVTRVEGVQAP